MQSKKIFLSIALTIIYLGFTGFIIPEKASQLVETKHFGPAECEAAMKYISKTWSEKDDLCMDAKRFAGLQIDNLINKERCFIGEHFRDVEKYIGQPDYVDRQGPAYYIVHKEKLQQVLIFEMHKDSSLIGLIVMKYEPLH